MLTVVCHFIVRESKRHHVPMPNRAPDIPPPIIIAVVGPPKVGKSTLIRYAQISMVAVMVMEVLVEVEEVFCQSSSQCLFAHHFADHLSSDTHVRRSARSKAPSQSSLV